MKSDAKLISYVIPCYNSAEYMDKCIQSILDCSSEDIEILIVDDGSNKDNTLKKAKKWEKNFPNIIRAIHQENGGHGAAVMKGLECASGIYFKVVDSDDWLDNDANCKLLKTLQIYKKDQLDMLVVNYVYEHVEDGKQNFVNYRHVLPSGKPFSWDEIGHFKSSQYILMHSIIYRTDMLRNSGLDLPRHTFYVDNIFAYVPLPYCKRIYYLDVNLYRYFIGRCDQSVNESVMVARIEQQIRITRIMIDAFKLAKDVSSKKLRTYMMSYLRMMLVICSVFSMLSDRKDKEILREKAWNHLREHDLQTYKRLRRSFMGCCVHIPGKAGNKLTLVGYHLAQKIFKFN